MSDEIVKYSNQFNNQALHFGKCSAYRVLAPVMAVQILGVPRRVGGGVGRIVPAEDAAAQGVFLPLFVDERLRLFESRPAPLRSSFFCE